MSAKEEETGPRIAYEISIEGVENADRRNLLERSSQLFELRDRPPATLLSLRRRAEQDLERLQKVLEAQGFYAADLSYRIDADAEPVAVTITVESGPLYVIETYDIRYVDDPPDLEALPRNPEVLGIEIRQPARASAVVDAQEQMLKALRNQGHPFPEVKDRRVVVDHDERTMAVTLDVAAGPRATFGPLAIRGTEQVEEDYLRRLVPWKPGDLYEQRDVEEYRRRLLATGLFETARIDPAETVPADGAVPMTATLSEGEHRSIGVGASYSSVDGFGGTVFWEHRNLLNGGERLRPALNLSQITQSADVTFRKPAFRRSDQDLLADLSALNSDTDAFEGYSINTAAGLERRVGRLWTVSALVSAEYANLMDESQEERRSSALLGLPLTARRDSTDSLLDPRQGTRLALTATPYAGSFEGPTSFLTFDTTGSTYYSFGEKDRFTLAARGRIGSLFGEDTAGIPPNKRFYAGGGGSVRGYGFQLVGPLDEEDDPVGGRSVAEVGFELRARVTDTIGIVPFIEGGNVYDEVYPDLSGGLLWAAGLGLRYFTPVGPIRLDVAFPLNRRDVDDLFQFYISLGQAF